MSSDTGDLRTIQVAVTGEDTPGEDRPEPSPDALIAGRYRVHRRIGKGGMGEVMAARDEQVGRDVAIKRMRAADPSPRAIARFLREAMVQGRLEHPAIVPVHEIGKDAEGLPFFVMKKLAGTSLAKLLEGDRASFPLQRVLRAFTDVCHAVELAHAHGIVHRDLKPDNIMIGDFGETYVLDWGVARVTGGDDDGDFADVDSESGEHGTIAGTAIGTPGYMSPEQVRGARDIDGRADVYTLGCMLFEILAGEPLHPRGYPGLQSALAGCDARPSQRGRAVAPELDAICVAATETLRDQRIASARELGERVERYLDGDRDLARRRDLARAHLDKAREAFGGDAADDGRRVAMREAAGALALDPALEGAAELVGRLMLEPPRTTPHEVTEAIHAEDVRAALAVARGGVWTVVLTLLFSPLLWWIAPSGSPYVAALTAIIVINGLVTVHSIVTKHPRPGLVIVLNAITVGIVARMFSPILVAPGVAAVLAMALTMTPRFSIFGSGWTIAGLFATGALVPLALERLDLVSRTVEFGSYGVLLTPPAIGGDGGPVFIVATMYVVASIGTSCFMASMMRQRTRSARERLELQAWQLRQLVPAGG